MPNKDDDARVLAESHYRIEPGITQIFRVAGDVTDESSPVEPIKLLEVNQYSIPSGIMPLRFDAVPAAGVHYPCVIIEITPEEFVQVQAKTMPLPNGWTVGDPIPRPADADAV